MPAQHLQVKRPAQGDTVVVGFMRPDDLAILAGIADGLGGAVNDQRRVDWLILAEAIGNATVLRKNRITGFVLPDRFVQSVPDTDEVLLG